MRIKYSDLSPKVRKALDFYSITLMKYYKSKGLKVEKDEVKKIISEKLKKVELTGAAGNPKKETITLKLSTYEEKINKYGIKVLEERPHTVHLNRKTGKAKCTCKWFSKYGVCKHVVKALLLKEHGPSWLRRKLNFPAYKENRKKEKELVAV